MKRISKKGFLTFFLFIVSLWNLSSQEIIIAYEDKEQPPYYLGVGDVIPKDYPGIAVEMILSIEQYLEPLKITLVRLPWSRCLLYLKEGKVDGIFNASFNAERLLYGWYPTENGLHSGTIDSSKRITNISYSLYKLKDSTIDWDGSHFQNLGDSELGAPLGYSIVNDLIKMKIGIYQFQSTKNGFEMLMRRRIPGIVVQDVTGDSILLQNYDRFMSIEKDVPEVISKDYYLMLSNLFVRENSDLAQKIWETLAFVRTNHMADLFQKYSETMNLKE